MNFHHVIKATALVALLLAGAGCNSKQEKAQQGGGAPPANGGDKKYMSGQNTAGTSVATPKDQADARAAALHVLAQMEAGEFAAIYRESSPGFQKIGKEADFAAKFEETRKKTGPLKNPHEISFATLPNAANVLLFGVENERYKSERRLTFARAQNGKMVLEGLNQHDEQKK